MKVFFSIRLCDLFGWYFIILNLVFSTGPCSPMRETVMISAWQKKGVSRYCYQVFMISTRYYQMCAGISLSAYSCSTGISAQKDCMPLLSHPIICKGKNIQSCTTDHSNHLTFPQYLCFRWRTGRVGWGVEQWKSDVCFLPGPGSKFWSAQICPH